ncbi:DUF2807 domain-containing protein [Gillisia sp. M10.2A]|uniref:DUF2807 domain-containing protein n=1 Tax=Gillisia lutea TaxID=2909668 RepID=A0ABS9ECM8_9FLAO|nr:head GIN domain-containing protein [Gillisia lutea]MCF4100630.1 DUF2807 domain-containing protein [Gillisia lutea]
MKKILFSMFIILGVQLHAQEITMDLENFSQAEVTNGLKVELIHGEVNKAVITGLSRDKVDVKVDKGVLSVKMALNNIWKEDNTLVQITYKQLHRIEARQGSDVEVKNNMKQSILELRAQEGSDIKAQLEIDNLVASSVTGASIKVMGTATNQEIEVKAAGDFQGENLIGKDVDINILGGGTANIYSNSYVNANIKAGGNIYIYGAPKNIDEKTTFGGTIKKIN